MAVSFVQRAKMLRWILANSYTYLLARKKTEIRYDRTAWFDLETNVFHRYLLNLMLMLEDQGYRISIKWRPAFVGSWHTNLLIRSVPNLRTHIAAQPKDNDLCFSDTQRPSPSILLDPHIFGPNLPQGAYKVPMSMVDSIYSKALHNWQPDLSTWTARRRVFFVGNVSPEYAKHEAIIEGFFKCFSRTHLLELIDRHFHQRIHRPASLEELQQPGFRDIVLIDRKIFNIPHEQLRPTLAMHDFFLAPAGVIMPLCHNLIEAMSVGCIPVLQHGHLLEPALINGHNCLAYANEEELLTVMRSIPSLDERTVLSMRSNVLEYYRDHLTPEAVIGAINRLTNGRGRIFLNAEHHSVECALQRSNAGTSR